MSLEREQRHLPILIAGCYVGNFILGGVGQALPDNSFWQLFSWQWGSLLFIAGSAVFAAKLATEKWHISSAGFILLSIGQGIFYTLQAHTDKSSASMSDFATGMMVFLPGMLFLCYYSGFPLWLRIFNVLSVIPFLVAMIKIDMKSYNEQNDMMYVITGFVMTQIAGLCWSYYALRPYKNIKNQH